MKITDSILILIFGVTFSYTQRILLDIYGHVENKPKSSNLDGPLILTPLIEANKIEEAQTVSKVNFSEFGNVTSHSGYFTVDKNFDSNLFFWFFPAFEDFENAPVVLWLQGGPGGSSLYGLFVENGPFALTEDGTAFLRSTTWARTSSVLYIDNPAGTGFSFTNGGFADNQTKVGEDLYTALQQFFTLFPDLQQRDFYITGESYAGKYVPAISYTILKKNPDADLKINLKGLAMGNGISEPKYQWKYGNRLYELGFIDENVQNRYNIYEYQLANYIEQGNNVMALTIFGGLIAGGQYSLFYNTTFITNVYNFMANNIPDYLDYLFSRDEVREAIHVGNTTFSNGFDVYSHLEFDIPLSVAPWVEELLENYRVLYYNGQLDLLVPYPPMVEYLRTLNFSSADEYKAAQRKPIIIEGEVAGYVKQAGNLIEVMVRNAGHMVPYDQPKWINDIIYSFTRNKDF